MAINITIHHIQLLFEVDGKSDEETFRKYFSELILEYEERKLSDRLGDFDRDLGDGPVEHREKVD